MLVILIIPGCRIILIMLNLVRGLELGPLENTLDTGRPLFLQQAGEIDEHGKHGGPDKHADHP